MPKKSKAKKKTKVTKKKVASKASRRGTAVKKKAKKAAARKKVSRRARVKADPSLLFPTSRSGRRRKCDLPDEETLRTTLSVDEVAKELQVHPVTVRRLSRRRQLPAVAVGAQWRFPKDAMRAFLEGTGMKGRKWHMATMRAIQRGSITAH